MFLGPGVTVIAVSAVGAFVGVFALLRLISAVRYCHQNNDGEQERLLGNRIHNVFGGLNPAIPSRPSPVGSSHPKADVNVIGSGVRS